MFHIKIEKIGPEIRFRLLILEFEGEPLKDAGSLEFKADTFFEFYNRFTGQPRSPFYKSGSKLLDLKGLAELAPDNIRSEILGEINRLSEEEK